MTVEFEALIKQLTIKSLVSCDKQARLILEFNAADDELMTGLNKLHRADECVIVEIKNKND